MADTRPSQQGVTLLHFVNCPSENCLSFFHIRHNRMHQMRQGLVRRQLNHLWIYHQHANLIRSSCHQHRHNDRIKAYTFASTSSACDEKMWHGSEINRHRISADILTEINRNLHVSTFGVSLLHHFTQTYHLPVCVGDLNANRIFSRNRGNDPNARNTECDCEVIGKICNFGEPQACFKLNLVLRDDWASLNLYNAHFKTKVGKGFFEYLRPFTNFSLLFIKLELFRR